MKISDAVSRRLAKGGKILCAGALALSLSAACVVPALAAEAAPKIPSLGALMGNDDMAEDPVEQEGFVGTWTIISMSDGTGGIEVGPDMMNLMSELGLEMTFEIYPDGTFYMAGSFNGETQEAEGTWVQLTDNEGSFEVNGDAVIFTLADDGTFYIADGEMNMTFARVEDVAAGKFSTAATAYLENPQGFVYTWKLVAMDLPGVDNDIPEELFSLAEAFGFSGALEFAADGTFTLKVQQGEGFEADPVKGAWKEISSTEAQLTAEGETMIATIADGRMALTSPDDDETVLLFAALDPNAVTAEVTGEQAYLGEWYSDALVGEDYAAAPGTLDADYMLEVYDDGTFVMTYQSGSVSDSVEGVWTYDAEWDDAVFTANGSDVSTFVDGDELYMDYDGTNYIVFVR